jgi:PAS domain S-box-containing protein
MIWLKRYKDLFIIIGEIVSNSFSNYIAEKYRLEAEEEMFKLLRAVDQSTNIIIIMDKNGYMEYVNSKFSEYTGYLFQEIVGTRPHFLDPEINSQFDLTSLWQEIEKGNPWEGKFQDVS